MRCRYRHFFSSEYFEIFHHQASSKYNSFPSGHSITAWSVATVIAEQYKETIVVPVFAYAIATGVGLSRVTLNAHWLSDAIVGASLGYGIGRYLVRHHKNTRWTLFPGVAKKNILLTGIYSL